MLPFDLNGEAEMLGARVRYHDGLDGNPVYPTIADKPLNPGDDIESPDALAEKELKIPKLLKGRSRKIKIDPAFNLFDKFRTLGYSLE